MKTNQIQNKQWFTLIELLVVITIIGILATGWVGIYTTQMQWARDSVRVQNMELLNSSLHQYYADKWKYPEMPTPAATTGIQPEFATELTIYNSNYPKDPKAGVPACWWDVWYVTWASDESWKDCIANYQEKGDDNGLPHAVFKIATRLEKRTNVDTDGIARTDNNHTDGKIDGRFEKFAGTGGDKIKVTELWYRIQ